MNRYACPLFSRATSYGSIPIIIAPTEKNLNGIFWRNSSEAYIEVKLDEKRNQSNVTWLSEVGNLDMVLFSSSDYKKFYKKLAAITGSAPLVPYFCLGYHHCRYSFLDETDMLNVDANFD